MIPYYIIIAIVILNMFISFKKPDKQNLLFYSTMILLFLFAALRGNGDVDYFNYKEYSLMFTDLHTVLFEKSFIEIGFRLISYINNQLGLNTQFVIVFMNFISLFSITYVFKKISINKLLSVFLFLPYFFQLDMHSSRTAVATSLGLLALYFLSEKKYGKYLLSLIVSISFHKTALVLLLPLFITLLKQNKYIASVGATITIGFMWVIKHFVSLTGILISTLYTLNMGRFAFKVESYSQSQFGQKFSLFDPRLLLAGLIFIVFSFLIRNNYIDFRKNKISERLGNQLLIYSFLSITAFIFLSDMTILAVRTTYYFNIASCITIPIILKEVNFNKSEIGSLFKVSIHPLMLKVGYFVLFMVYLVFIFIVLPKVPYLLFIN